MRGRRIAMRWAWILLTVVGAAIGGFGVVTLLAPGDGPVGYVRAVAVASVGAGLFGVLITVVPFRRGERWAWFALWYYPVLWLAHLALALPPGKDHVHQAVFLVLSVAGLLLAAPTVFPRASD